MRKRIDLYIGGIKADLEADAPIVFNYTQEDLEKPTAVKNSYSQSITLPGTDTNNRIFDHYFRHDHAVSSGFNALKRVPFEMYNELSEVVESGYVKLNAMEKGAYSITLYGGLGSFLYGLMYDASGNKRSLADLDYGETLDFTINRDAVRDAWRQLTGIATSDDKWDIINFAPAYNGIPSGEFDAKKGFCPNTCYGIRNYVDGYGTRQGHALCDFEQDVDEWAASDLRSYLQRPVISVKAVLDAICDPDNNGGYTVNLDAAFFNSSNAHYSKAWMTLPMLDSVQLPASSISGFFSFGGGSVYPIDFSTHSKSFSDAQLKGDYNGKYDIALTFIPTMRCTDSINAVAAWEDDDAGAGRRGQRVATMYQLVALDADGNVIGGSQAVMVTTKAISIDGGALIEETVDPATFIRKYNDPVGTKYHTYAPAWNPTGDDGIYAPAVNGIRYAGTTFGSLMDEDSDTMHVTLKIDGVSAVSSIRLDVTPIAVYWSGSSNIQYYQTAAPTFKSYAGVTITNVTGLSFAVSTNHCPYTIVRSGTVHSGASITKALLLGGTDTPADYLLSYVKQYGLYIAVDRGSKTVDIMQRDTFFGNATPVSLEGRIDSSTIRQQPYSITSRWYDFAAETEGSFADYYKSVYGRTYGMARVNTGFEFNADHNELMKGNVFKGAAEVLARNKYFVRVSEQAKPMPSPFLDGGKFTLWNASGETQQFDIITATDAAAIEYVNPTYPGYDLSFMPKPEFRDKDGKALDGDNVLLFFDGKTTSAYYNRYTLTDDNGMMTQFNDGTPCWLLGQHSLAANADYVIGATLPMPRFHRFRDAETSSVLDSMEFGTPAEIDNPSRTVSDSVSIYSRRWAAYFSDLMDVDSRVMTCKVRLGGLGRVGTELMRSFFWYGNAIWVMSAIKNYALNGDGMTECELVKVKDIDNYNNGQA